MNQGIADVSEHDENQTAKQSQVDRIVLPDLPTRFRGCMWNDHWEFDAPCVLYFPYYKYGFGGNSGEIYQMVESVCIDLSIEDKPVDFNAMRAELESECEWRGWSLRGFSKRKQAAHVQWDVRWWRDDSGELQFEIHNEVEQDGPFDFSPDSEPSGPLQLQ